MPLPAALAAKLAKRGLVTENKNDKKRKSNDTVEEVFAEDYDDNDVTLDNTIRNTHPNNVDYNDDEDEDQSVIYERSKCPNQLNIFHKCTEYCFTTFGIHEWNPKVENELKRIKMLQKYPLAAEWIEVKEPISGRCYYWNTESDLVSWMPPGHVKFHPRISANKIKANEAESLRSATIVSKPIMATSAFERFTEENLDNREKLLETTELRDARSDREKKDQDRKDKRKRDKAQDKLDPMDPAAYSDIARGDWRSGLDDGGAKSGVDSTASGPLFQSRPYPSPGDILRQNKQT